MRTNSLPFIPCDSQRQSQAHVKDGRQQKLARQSGSSSSSTRDRRHQAH